MSYSTLKLVEEMTWQLFNLNPVKSSVLLLTWIYRHQPYIGASPNHILLRNKAPRRQHSVNSEPVNNTLCTLVHVRCQLFWILKPVAWPHTFPTFSTSVQCGQRNWNINYKSYHVSKHIMIHDQLTLSNMLISSCPYITVTVHKLDQFLFKFPDSNC